MIILRLLNGHLDKNVKHLATTWQVADNKAFVNPIVNIENDVNNKNSIAINVNLDPNSVWYARARMKLSNGDTIWGNLNIFTPHTQEFEDTTSDLPSKITVPQVYTSSVQDSHDLSAFKIHAEGFEVVGDSTHSSTSWIIENMDGTVVWSSLYNTINKNNITIASIILKPNCVFRIKVLFHSSSNDTSPIGCYTIRTADSRNIELLTYLDFIDTNSPLKLRIAAIEGVKRVTWEIYTIVEGIAKVSLKKTTSDENIFSTIIDTNTLEPDTMCMLKVTTDKEELGSKFIPFRTRPTSKKLNMELIVPDDNVDMRFETLDEYTDTEAYPPIYYDRDRFRFNKSKLTVTEILGLPDSNMQCLVYSRGKRLEGEITLLQHLIMDNWTGLLNHPIAELANWKLVDNNNRDFYINQYVNSMRIGLPTFEFPELDDPIIPSLTDETGALVVKGLEPYNAEQYNINGKPIVLTSLILDYNDNVMPMATNNNEILTKLLIEKLNESDDEVPENPHRFALTLQDGVCGSVDSRRGVFGFSMSPYLNGSYRLVLVDIKNKQKIVIPFNIDGTRSRSNNDYRFFGLSLTRQTNPKVVDSNPFSIQTNYINDIIRIPLIQNQPKLIYYAGLNTTIGKIVSSSRDVVIKRQSRDKFTNDSEMESLSQSELEAYKNIIKQKLGGIYREDTNYGSLVIQTSLKGEQVVKFRCFSGDEVTAILEITTP